MERLCVVPRSALHTLRSLAVIKVIAADCHVEYDVEVEGGDQCQRQMF